MIIKEISTSRHDNKGYNRFMRLKRITLKTAYFEDYLTFFSEVLELDVLNVTDSSLELDLMGTILEFKKAKLDSPSENLEFALTFDEYEAMLKKIDFFYYRKGASRFLLRSREDFKTDLIDPDGRLWRFSRPAFMESHFSLSELR